MRFVADPRDAAKAERPRRLLRPARDLGVHPLLLQRALSREASTRATRSRSSGPRRCRRGSTTTWARSTRTVCRLRAKTTGWLRETELVLKTQGIVLRSRTVRDGSLKHGKVPIPIPPHVAEGIKESRALYDLVKEQDRQGALGIVQGERALSRLEHAPGVEGHGSRDQADVSPGEEPTEAGRRMRKVAYYKGCLASLSAKELDISTQALSPKVGLELVELEAVTCRGAGDIHEAEPDYYLHRTRAHPRLRRGDRVRHADDGLQRLHAQPALVRTTSSRATRRCSSGSTTTSPRSGSCLYGQGRGSPLPLAGRRGEGYDLLRRPCTRAEGPRIAPFYGCQILALEAARLEDPDRPSSLERIIEARGGEAIDYPAKIKCCGFPIIQAREETALGELIQPIEQAKEAADAIVLARSVTSRSTPGRRS